VDPRPLFGVLDPERIHHDRVWARGLIRPTPRVVRTGPDDS
jgi:hypothetical protein